mgnify:CR=1 FL=1
MTENEIIEVISNSHLGELYTVIKETYDEDKHKTLINIDKEITLGDKNKVSYSIVTGVEHSDILDKVFYRIVEITDCKFPKDLPTGSSIYFSNKNRKNGRTIISMNIDLTIDDVSVSFYFGYFKPATN